MKEIIIDVGEHAGCTTKGVNGTFESFGGGTGSRASERGESRAYVENDGGFFIG